MKYHRSREMTPISAAYTFGASKGDLPTGKIRNGRIKRRKKSMLFT
jgi:hypothetical protein